MAGHSRSPQSFLFNNQQHRTRCIILRCSFENATKPETIRRRSRVLAHSCWAVDKLHGKAGTCRFSFSLSYLVPCCPMLSSTLPLQPGLRHPVQRARVRDPDNPRHLQGARGWGGSRLWKVLVLIFPTSYIFVPYSFDDILLMFWIGNWSQMGSYWPLRFEFVPRFCWILTQFNIADIDYRL